MCLALAEHTKNERRHRCERPATGIKVTADHGVGATWIGEPKIEPVVLYIPVFEVRDTHHWKNVNF